MVWNGGIITRIAGTHSTSLVDGFGVNFTIFLQGCKHHCEECHNPSTWDFNGGTEVSIDELKEKILSYVPPVTGVTFSGGDPVEQPREVEELARWCGNNGLQTTLYTGYTLAQLRENNLINVNLFDYIVDGKFNKSLKSCFSPFRGSSNQDMWKRQKDGSFVKCLC